MLVPYEALLSLPDGTIDNLIKEHLLTQVEDGDFDNTNKDSWQAAITRSKQALKSGLLLVEYSEEDESIAIRHQNDLNI